MRLDFLEMVGTTLFISSSQPVLEKDKRHICRKPEVKIRKSEDVKIGEVKFEKSREGGNGISKTRGESKMMNSTNVRFESSDARTENVRFVKPQNAILEEVKFLKFEDSRPQKVKVEEARIGDGRFEKMEYLQFQNDASDEEEDVRRISFENYRIIKHIL